MRKRLFADVLDFEHLPVHSNKHSLDNGSSSPTAYTARHIMQTILASATATVDDEREEWVSETVHQTRDSHMACPF